MRRLKNELLDKCSDVEIAQLVGAYDVVGDVAIIIVPESLVDKERLIGEAVLASNRRLRTVAKRAGQYSGEFRTIALQVIAGRPTTETEVREFGVRLSLDPARVYYSVRSGSERKRVASQVRQGERVLVMFSGVAPFPLVIARHSSAGRIVGIEKNPLAHEYACRNLGLNKKTANIVLYPGDVHDVLGQLKERFDRIIMPLPTMAEQYLQDALAVLCENGTIHFYDMQPPDMFQAAVEKVRSACLEAGRRMVSAEVVRCGHCSPRVYRICVDAVIQ